VKKRIIQSSESDTVLVMQSLHNPARVLRNPWAEKVLELEGKGASLQELVPFISGQVSLKGWTEGRPDEALFPCGQVVGRIDDVPSVADLMKRIVDEALEVKERLSQLIG
jgi:NAD(P)H-dependent flavin oxidoreductase YrpB (nitropropane dioxygenase family)